jgi:hypothetical protein
MKKLLVALFLLLPFAVPAKADSLVVQTCGTLPLAYAPGATRFDTVDINGNKCISGSISASFASFHPSSSLTPITATTGGVTSSAFTAGQAILAQNVGATNAAYCSPGGSASTSGQYIAPGSSALIQTTTETTITCATSTSTTTVNFQVGTGLWTGAGGGGGSSGGGSTNITQTAGTGINATVAATGALPIDVIPNNNLATLLGAPVPCKAAATWNASTGLTGTNPVGCDGSAALWGDVGAVGGAVVGTFGTAPGAVPAVPVNAAITQLPDPCMSAALKVNFAIGSSSGNIQIVAGSASKKVYLCSLSLIAAATAVVNVIEGTGGACTTANELAVIGSTTAASGMSLAANGGLTLGNGAGTVGVTATAANGLCILQSGTTALAGNATYVQQ